MHVPYAFFTPISRFPAFLKESLAPLFEKSLAKTLHLGFVRGRFVYFKSFVFCGSTKALPYEFEVYWRKAILQSKILYGVSHPVTALPRHPSLRKGLKISFAYRNDLIRLGEIAKNQIYIITHSPSVDFVDSSLPEGAFHSPASKSIVTSKPFPEGRVARRRVGVTG